MSQSSSSESGNSSWQDLLTDNAEQDAAYKQQTGKNIWSWLKGLVGADG